VDDEGFLGITAALLWTREKIMNFF